MSHLPFCCSHCATNPRLTSGALQRLDATARCFCFRRLQALLQIQLNRQLRPASGNHISERMVLDRRHGFGSHIVFNNLIGPVLKIEWLLELNLKSSNHQARTGVTPSSFRTIGATTVPRISMASNIFWCGRVETPIWNVMREMPPRTSFT